MANRRKDSEKEPFWASLRALPHVEKQTKENKARQENFIHSCIKISAHKQTVI